VINIGDRIDNNLGDRYEMTHKFRALLLPKIASTQSITITVGSRSVELEGVSVTGISTAQ
jgi:hypothetical protein